MHCWNECKGRLGLKLDFGNWRGERKYDDLAKIAPLADCTHAKAAYSSPGEMDHADFTRCLDICRDAGFSGPHILIFSDAGDEWDNLDQMRDVVLPYLAQRQSMIYAIGDIHGEADALREMLAKLPVQPSDLVVFLGDAINRGPDPFDCIEQILAFERCRKVFIQGNHEEAMLLFLEEGDVATLAGLNGQATLDSYARAGYALTPGDPDSLPLPHLRLYAQMEPWTLPFYITDDYIFTHAGWDLALPLPMQSTGALRWGKVKGEDPALVAADRRARPHAVPESHVCPEQALYRRGYRLRHGRLSERRRPAVR